MTKRAFKKSHSKVAGHRYALMGRNSGKEGKREVKKKEEKHRKELKMLLAAKTAPH
jgi:hypothetical protein